MTQEGHVFFCLDMAPLPADGAREACFFIASNGRLGARSHLRNSIERKPSRFVSSLECCLGARKHRGEALSSTTSPRHMSRRWSCFARAPSRSQFGSIWRQFSSLASTCFSLRTLLARIRNLCGKRLARLRSPRFLRHTRGSQALWRIYVSQKKYELQQTYRAAIVKPLLKH